MFELEEPRGFPVAIVEGRKYRRATLENVYGGVDVSRVSTRVVLLIPVLGTSEVYLERCLFDRHIIYWLG